MLNPTIVELVLIHVLRDAAVNAQFRMSGVRPEELRGTAFEYLTPVVSAICSYMAKAGSALPTYDVILAECANYFPSETPETTIRYTGALIARAYQIPEEDLRPLYVLDPKGPLQELIYQLKVIPKVQLAAGEFDPQRMNSRLDAAVKVRDASKISAAQYVDIFDPVKVQELTTRSNLEKTNMSWWDEAIGGMPQICSAGVLASTGGGKTTFGVQLACESVIMQRNTMIATYEQNLEGDLVERMYRYMLGMSRKQLSNGWESYNTVLDKIKTYRPIMQKYFRLFPMAGDFDGQGTGGLNELQVIIRNLIQQEKWRPNLLIIDWLEPVLWRWTGAAAATGIHEYQKQLKYVMDGIKFLRDQFRMKVVILHQIASSKAESLKPGDKPTHHMAAEIKSFADLLNVSCAFGKVDPETSCMNVNWSKVRYNKTAQRVVKLDAENDRIISVPMMLNDDRYGNEPIFIQKAIKHATPT